jgi:hypothetical protein
MERAAKRISTIMIDKYLLYCAHCRNENQAQWPLTSDKAQGWQGAFDRILFSAIRL